MRRKGSERSAKRPRSRLIFQIFPTVVELLNLEHDVRDWSGGRPGRDREEDNERLLSLQQRGLIEDLEKQDYDLDVVETAIESLRGGYVRNLVATSNVHLLLLQRYYERERLEVCTMGMVASLLFFLFAARRGDLHRSYSQRKNSCSMARRRVQACTYI